MSGVTYQPRSGENSPSQPQNAPEIVSHDVVWVDGQGILVSQSGPVTTLLVSLASSDPVEGTERMDLDEDAAYLDQLEDSISVQRTEARNKWRKTS